MAQTKTLQTCSSVALPLLSVCKAEIREVKSMQFVINMMAILTVMVLSFQLSLLLSRGLLSLMILSMQRWESRVRK
jgi:hypothetical protein